MKETIKIKKLNEAHESFGPEVLDMTVGELLDTLQTVSPNDYSVLEEIISANELNFSTSSYDTGEESFPSEEEKSIETEEDFEENETSDEAEAGQEFPTFDQANQDLERAGDKQQLEEFQF